MKPETKHYFSPDKLYGDAIDYVRTDEDGTMWVGNGEYESQVNFCPFTGTPAVTQMKIKKEGSLEWAKGEPYTEYE